MTISVSHPGLQPVRPLAQALLEHLPRLGGGERRLGRTLYRLLAEGRPVRPERLASALSLPTPAVERLLQGPQLRGLVYRGDQREIVGFAGLATAPMHHRMEIDGVTLYAWCAWDTLFIPPVLGATATVASADPVDGTVVRLDVTPRGIHAPVPADAVLSFVDPDAADFTEDAHRTMAAFCHQIYFFASRRTAETWTADHAGTRIVSLDEAWHLGQLLNATRWGTP